jgi:hypothetical protein
VRPRISILDPRFVYVNAVSTDVRKTFERARQEQLRAAQLAAIKVEECEAFLIKEFEQLKEQQ